jgi:hypothetical protein
VVEHTLSVHAAAKNSHNSDRFIGGPSGAVVDYPVKIEGKAGLDSGVYLLMRPLATRLCWHLDCGRFLRIALLNSRPFTTAGAAFAVINSLVAWLPQIIAEEGSSCRSCPVRRWCSHRPHHLLHRTQKCGRMERKLNELETTIRESRRNRKPE